MNQDTGEIRKFANDQIIPKGWIHWAIDEIVEVKGCMFRVMSIDHIENTIKLKGINRKTRKSIERS